MAERILIADGGAAGPAMCPVLMSQAGYSTLVARDGRMLMRVARAERPALILLDLALPDLPGAEVIAALRADPVTRAIPIIALAAPGAEESRLAALRAGADDVMAHETPGVTLLARIRNLQRRRAATGVVATAWGTQAQSMFGMAETAQAFEPAGTIGLLAFRPEAALLLKHNLRGRMRDHVRILTREEALAFTPGRGGGAPEVLMIAADPDEGGLHLMSQLATHPGTRHSAFCVMLDEGNASLAATAFDLDAGAVILPETPPEELTLRLRALIRRKREHDRVRATVEDSLRLAMIDPLTGIYNRRYAIPRLAGIAQQAASEGAGFAVIMVDLDHFKDVNDAHGHAAGDAVLAEVGRRLSHNLRMRDLLARYGGEEFLIALPQTSRAEAEEVAERLRHLIGNRPIRLASGEELTVTASLGVALVSCAEAAAGDIAAMIERADRALLAAKTGGRNMVTFHGAPS